MPPLVRAMPVDIELTERSIAHYCSESCQRLLKNLFTVCDEEERKRPASWDPSKRFIAVIQSAIVERRDDSFACASRRDDEITPAVMPVSLNGEQLEHLALMRPRLDLDAHEVDDYVWRRCGRD